MNSTQENEFRKRAAAATAVLTPEAAESAMRQMDRVLDAAGEFGRVRRRAVRAALLVSRGRSLPGTTDPNVARGGEAIENALGQLRRQLELLTPILSGGLDDVLASVAAEENGALERGFRSAAAAAGFSSAEAAWAWNEIAKTGFRAMSLLPHGVDDLHLMLDTAAISELGVLNAGFPVLGGETDDRIARFQQLVAALSEKRVTPGFYFVISVVLLATAVVAARRANESSAQVSTVERHFAGLELDRSDEWVSEEETLDVAAQQLALPEPQEAATTSDRADHAKCSAAQARLRTARTNLAAAERELQEAKAQQNKSKQQAAQRKINKANADIQSAQNDIGRYC